jgi:hypothetical protein
MVTGTDSGNLAPKVDFVKSGSLPSRRPPPRFPAERPPAHAQRPEIAGAERKVS